MQVQQRALGCGGSPAYGPIPRYAKIWQAVAYSRRIAAWTIGLALGAYAATYAIERARSRTAAEAEKWVAYRRIGAWAVRAITIGAYAWKAWAGRITGALKTSETKCCGDFDNQASLGVYIC
jgi:hypothetical protein